MRSLYSYTHPSAGMALGSETSRLAQVADPKSEKVYRLPGDISPRTSQTTYIFFECETKKVSRCVRCDARRGLAILYLGSGQFSSSLLLQYTFLYFLSLQLVN